MNLFEFLEPCGLPPEVGELLEQETLPSGEAARVLARTLAKAGLPPQTKGGAQKMKKIRFGALLLAGVLCAGSMAVYAAFRMDKRIAQELGVSSSGAQDTFEEGGNAFEESGNEIGSSVTSEGWTLTVQQAVGDRNCAYLLLDLTAPEGTVLDADSYFLNCEPYFEDAGSGAGGGWRVDLLEDENPADNRLSFLVDLSFERDMRSGQGVLIASRLEAIHWSEDHQSDRVEPVNDLTWEVPFWLDYNDEALVCRPGQVVQASQGEIRVEQAEITPLSVSLKLSGEGARCTALDTVVPGTVAIPGRAQLELLDTQGGHISLGGFRAVEKEDGVFCVMTLVPVVDPAEVAALVIDGVTVPLKNP